MHTIIIAEAGVNHNGNPETALKMVEEAAKTGVDYVKFQTFVTELCISTKAPKAEYQKNNTNNEDSQFEMVKKLELDIDAHHKIIEHCKKHNIKFLSTPFDLVSIDTLKKLGFNLWKIPSGEITNLPYLRKIGSMNDNVILSTGMSNLGEIEKALEILEQAGTKRKNITILHCNTEYPTPYEDVNLNAMNTIKNAFKTEVGYSDHTEGIEIPIAAVALGAKIIEKHFTLDKSMDGPDHKASLNPEELMQMVKSIRNIEKALGNGIKSASPSEQKNIYIARKSIVAAKNMKKGDTFTEQNITVKRPGSGISPMMWDEIIGKKAKIDFNQDDLIIL